MGIGASPAALVLGAELAARHAGPIPLWTLLLGLGLVAALAWGQGSLGMAPPRGDGLPFGEVVKRYLAPGSSTAVNALLALAMVGWFGFNVALGGAALAALLGVGHLAGVAVCAGVVLVGYRGGSRRWNLVAVVTTSSSLLLAGLVVAVLTGPTSPVGLRPPSLELGLADLGSAAGYIAVFATRAPDFTTGLARPGDLYRCVLLLVTPLAAMVLAGAVLHLGSGITDVVATLTTRGLALGNALVAAAVIAPTFTTLHSGSLAFRSLFGLGGRMGEVAVFAAGTVLAATGFHRHLLAWLALLAATLPVLIVPMALEARRRRRRVPPRRIPLWVWLPAGAVGLTLTVLGARWGPVTGLAVALVVSVLWSRTAAPTAGVVAGSG